jgi:hypothetical protein
LIVSKELLFHLQSVSAADRVLKILPHSYSFRIIYINKVLLDRYKVLNKLFLRIPLNFLYLLDLNLKQILLLILIHLILKNEEVQNNLEHMRLQQRNEHEHTLVIHYSNDLVEISIAFGHSLSIVVNSNGIECTFIDRELENITGRI